MEIISWNFLYFTAAVLIVYYFLNRKAQNIWLLIASAFFIFTWGWPHLIPLIIIGAVTFLIGKKLNGEDKKIWLLAGISMCIAAFIVYRVLNSPLFNIAGSAALNDPQSLIKQFLLPLGFSFYILQAISYLIDVSKSKIAAETSIIDFYLYLMYFPKILAGPIERAGNFLPQLKKDRIVDNQKLIQGFTLIMFGLFRKIVIAEVLLSILPPDFIHAAVINTHPSYGLFSFPFFTYAETIPYTNRFIGIIGYGIYLYNDFAGYTGIVRGISLFLGINLISNFQVPYFSTSLSDFWNHWHISLSSWLRDYIYFPLTRFYKKKTSGRSSLLPIIIPLLTTMVISGLWHDMTFPLLLWGFTYGFFMILEQLVFQKWPVLRSQQQSKVYKIFSGIMTFILVTFAWIPFTAGSLGEIFAFLKVLLKGSGWNLPASFNPWIVVLIFVSFLLDFFHFKYKDEFYLLKWPLPARASILAVDLLALILAFTWTSQYVSKVFVYQGF